MAEHKLEGVVHETGLGEKRRHFLLVALTFGEARQFLKPEPFHASKGTGEQRAIIPTHAAKLRKEMEAGTYTPTPVAVGLRPRHLKVIKYGTGPVPTASLTIEDDDSLPLTDGGHRFEALEKIRFKAEETLKWATEQEKAQAQAYLDLVEAQVIPIIVHLDGDTQKDFLNLQLGRAVDRAHLISLQAEQSDGDSNLKRAVQVARRLAENKDSPFNRNLRFDSHGYSGFPVSTLCSNGGSDLGTSLVGLVKVGHSQSPEWLAKTVVAAFKTLQKKAPELLEPGKVLTPPPNGTKGAATMLIGLGVTLAYRLIACKEETKPSEQSLDALVAAARETLDLDIRGNFAGPEKRKLLGEFAKELFADLPDKKHEGVPVDLLKTLSPSAFGLGPLPKKSRQKVSCCERAVNRPRLTRVC